MDILYYKKYEPIFGEWKIVREIGEGSFGKVFEIEREDFGYTYKAALKAITIPQSESELDSILDSGMDIGSATTYCQGIVKELNEEFRLMSKLKGNSNVVSYEDHKVIEHSDGIGWDILIRMELLTPLTKYSRQRPLDKQAVIQMGIDICKALELCRKHDIVHRDIKPENIFVSDDGQFKLGDFGIAKTIEQTTGSIGKKGTYNYMAPEVYKGEPYGSRVDIYSLGIMLYKYMNNGRLPFQPPASAQFKASDNERAISKRISGEKITAPANADENLSRVILKACEYKPENRYSSPAEMREDLEAVVSGGLPLVAMAALNEAATVKEHIGRNNADENSSDSFSDIGNDKTVSMLSGTGTAKANKKTKEQRATDESSDEEVAVAAVVANPAVENSKAKSESKANAESQATKNLDSSKKKRKTSAIIAAVLLVAIVVGIAAFRGPGYQENWTEWAEELPKGVDEDDYLIEEQTLYRSRDKETTSSTDSSMDGWELEELAENGDFGAWSSWSETPVSASSTREVESETRYRSRNLETKTSSSSSLSGWELTDTTYSWGDYGSWSSWSTSAVSSSDSRKVETKTQYRYRSISTVTKTGDWGSWSSWQDSAVSSNSNTKVETRTVYHYYYYLCPHCGGHMYQYNTCYKWAGGCGGNIPSSAYNGVWLTTPYSSTSDFEGTGVNYVYSGGERYFAFTSTSSQYYIAPKTQYRYCTRSTYQEKEYGSWSSWSDTAYSSSSSRDVETRTVYRYCDRSQVPTYHFQRWGDWSSWSTSNPGSSSTKQVENKLFYRYRDKTNETTYIFYRWTDWSEWSETPVEASDENEVETKTVYRYKSK